MITGEGTTWHMSVEGWDPVRGKASGSDYDNDANDLRYYVDDADGTTEAQVGLRPSRGNTVTWSSIPKPASTVIR